MRILHVIPGLDEVGNGISVAARLIANEQGADLVEARLFASGKCDASQYDEVWVHSAWSPMVLRSCRRVLKLGKRLVRMAHANYDPVRLRYHGWKKTLAGPIERFFLRRAKTLIATCEAEKGWIESYLGRRHPLKGLSYLETALATYYNKWSSAPSSLAPTTACADNPSSNPSRKAATYYNKCPIEFRVVSDAFGDELERVWDWCDVLVLPTLSENFGLVIAEALERGKCVITTDGAPAWGENLSRVERVDGGMWSGYGGRLIYLKGYRDGTPEDRVRLLKSAIENLLSRASLTPPASHASLTSPAVK